MCQQEAAMSSIPPKNPNRREAAAEERRQAILEAALQEFAEKGFAAARLEDVAQRAGVAKGTIYLLCKDKQDLFQQVVLGAIAPALERLTPPPVPTQTTIERFRALVEFFLAEVLGTNRRLVVQIILKDAPRFPEIAEFWHREVLSKIVDRVGEEIRRAQREGLLRSDAYAKFPQLAMAPMLLSLVWDANFARFAPLDYRGLLTAHLEALFGPAVAKDPEP
jgi:AcrR family transcriptional regulator